MIKRSVKENKKTLDSLINNPVALTILGLGKEGSSNIIYFSADMKKIYNIFSELKKDFPKLFEKIKFDQYNYSSEVQRGMDLFVNNEIISRAFNNFENYSLDKRRVYELYRNLSKEKKEIANYLGKRFYEELKK